MVQLANAIMLVGVHELTGIANVKNSTYTALNLYTHAKIEVAT